MGERKFDGQGSDADAGSICNCRNQERRDKEKRSEIRNDSEAGLRYRRGYVPKDRHCIQRIARSFCKNPRKGMIDQLNYPKIQRRKGGEHDAERDSAQPDRP